MPSFPASCRARRRLAALSLSLLPVLAPAPVAAQHGALTLRDAFDRAATRAVANRTARAASDVAAGQRVSTWRSILPTLRAEAGYIRTTDPVGAFGASLRQRRITATDFDPARLNYPGATGNYGAGVVIEQPLVALDGWLAARAATRGVESQSRLTEWTAVTTSVEVVDAYYGAVLAAERTNSVAAATRAAQAHARQAEHLLEAGFVTRSDVLLASARAGELDAARLAATRDSVLAQRHLALLLGESPGATLTVPSRFPADSIAERLAHEVLAIDARNRADVAGAEARVAAANADVGRTKAAFVPRLMSFARTDLSSQVRPASGSSNWTVGVMASWTPFTGASEIGERQVSEARRNGARAELEDAIARAHVDLERTELAVRTALARLDVARATVGQAVEAHRIVTRKYDGGLATVSELLDASTAELMAQLGLTAARHDVLVAVADRLRSTGHDPVRMAAVLDPAAAQHND